MDVHKVWELLWLEKNTHTMLFIHSICTNYGPNPAKLTYVSKPYSHQYSSCCQHETELPAQEFVQCIFKSCFAPRYNYL